MLTYRHAKEVEAIQSKIQEGEEKAKNDLEGQVSPTSFTTKLIISLQS
jgi:hypothetical protein